MGSLLGIAQAPAKRAPLIAVEEGSVILDSGLAGDARRHKSGRQVTVLFKEGWDAACKDLGVHLSWLTRRANLLVTDLPLPKEGARLAIGSVLLEVTSETAPCHLMDAAHPGLKAALTPDWRGGVCCRVIAAGTIRVGDPVERA
jgi:MOSC domain-containing protein YiiM